MIERRRCTHGRWLGRDAYFLAPGWVMTSREPVRLHAVLGVCVAVCIRDRRQANGGMCHYIWPKAPSPAEATPCYGDAALAALLRSLAADGSASADLEAWIFGGALPVGTGDDLRRRVDASLQLARDVLARRGIGVVCEDVGGVLGRKIAFDLGSGQALVLKTRNLRKRDWAPVISA